VPISIPESLVVALPLILSPSSRIFVKLTLVSQGLRGIKLLDEVLNVQKVVVNAPLFDKCTLASGNDVG
jgi:hypothetical protein